MVNRIALMLPLMLVGCEKLADYPSTCDPRKLIGIKVEELYKLCGKPQSINHGGVEQYVYGGHYHLYVYTQGTDHVTDIQWKEYP